MALPLVDRSVLEERGQGRWRPSIRAYLELPKQEGDAANVRGCKTSSPGAYSGNLSVVRLRRSGQFFMQEVTSLGALACDAFASALIDLAVGLSHCKAWIARFATPCYPRRPSVQHACSPSLRSSNTEVVAALPARGSATRGTG